MDAECVVQQIRSTFKGSTTVKEREGESDETMSACSKTPGGRLTVAEGGDRRSTSTR